MNKITEAIAKIVKINADDIHVEVDRNTVWSGTVGADDPCEILRPLLTMDAVRPGDSQLRVISIHGYGASRLLVNFMLGETHIELLAISKDIFADYAAGKIMLCC